jgi:mono/diheme cytochrome c family protein
VVASALIGVYALLGMLRQRLYVNAATGFLLCALAFLATAGGEFVRGGVRKPFTVRDTLYSNSIMRDEVAYLRTVGSTTHDPYPLRRGEQLANDQLRLGAKVFRFQCSVCHTMNGANGLEHLTESWFDDQKRIMIAQLQHTKTFMPPFAGSPEELEALVQYLAWHNTGRPANWQVSDDPQTRDTIRRLLQEAGAEPGVESGRGEGLVRRP